MHQLDDAGERGGVGLGRHAVAEVEHVRGCDGAAAQHVAHRRLEHRPRGGEQRRVEVALQRNARADPRRRDVERHPVVDADGVDADAAHGGSSSPVPTPKCTTGTAREIAEPEASVVSYSRSCTKLSARADAGATCAS